MLEQVVHALVESKNEAADEVLLEALRLGTEPEQAISLAALWRRSTDRALRGILETYEALPPRLRQHVLDNVKRLHHTLRECGRARDPALRLTALRLIALGRQAKLAYVLCDNLHEGEETISRAAAEGLVALAQWISEGTRRVQTGRLAGEAEVRVASQELLENRGEIEAAVARAIDVHRGRHGAELLRAALLLCDGSPSRTLAILQTPRHGGQSAMIRRLQQTPAAEHVPALLLAASLGPLRPQFAPVLAHIEQGPVLDALLARTHWLKDQQLQVCMHQVTRGTWWDETGLATDLARRTPYEAGLIGEWLAVSGVPDALQDERMERLRQHAADDFSARLRLLRVAARRRNGSSTQLLRSFLADPQERLARMAARELARRRPADYENVLLQQMTSAGDSVRRVIGRAIGKIGFEQFWQRFDRLDRITRKQAGKAMLKILPDAVQRLNKRLSNGPVEQRLKAMQITQELGLANQLRDALLQLCCDPDAKVRSKAITVVGDMQSLPPDLLLDRVLNDSSARVRANAIEVLETKQRTDYVPLLMQRARASNNRERANAIKALHRMKVGTASTQLLGMLRDERPEHRVSAMWTLRQIGFWQLLNEVARLAKDDANLRVRRYALGVLRGVAEMVQAERGNAG